MARARGWLDWREGDALVWHELCETGSTNLVRLRQKPRLADEAIEPIVFDGQEAGAADQMMAKEGGGGAGPAGGGQQPNGAAPRLADTALEELPAQEQQQQQQKEGVPGGAAGALAGARAGLESVPSRKRLKKAGELQPQQLSRSPPPQRAASSDGSAQQQQQQQQEGGSGGAEGSVEAGPGSDEEGGSGDEGEQGSDGERRAPDEFDTQ